MFIILKYIIFIRLFGKDCCLVCFLERRNFVSRFKLVLRLVGYRRVVYFWDFGFDNGVRSGSDDLLLSFGGIFLVIVKWNYLFDLRV